jgi:hypothetical protein
MVVSLVGRDPGVPMSQTKEVNSCHARGSKGRGHQVT